MIQSKHIRTGTRGRLANILSEIILYNLFNSLYFYSICFWLVAVIGVNQFVWNIPRILIPRNLFVLTTLFVVVCRWELVKAAVVKLDKSSASLRESALRWSVRVQYWLKINVAPFVSVSEQSQSCCICFILFFLLQKVILVSLLLLCMFCKDLFFFHIFLQILRTYFTFTSHVSSAYHTSHDCVFPFDFTFTCSIFCARFTKKRKHKWKGEESRKSSVKVKRMENRERNKKEAAQNGS